MPANSWKYLMRRPKQWLCGGRAFAMAPSQFCRSHLEGKMLGFFVDWPDIIVFIGMARLAGHNRDLHYYVAKIVPKAYFLCIEMGVAKSEKLQRNTLCNWRPAANMLKIATPPMRNATFQLLCPAKAAGPAGQRESCRRLCCRTFGALA